MYYVAGELDEVVCVGEEEKVVGLRLMVKR
jgi:hypothetical protein